MTRRASNAPNLEELIGSIYDLAGQDGLRQQGEKSWEQAVEKILALSDAHCAALQVASPAEGHTEVLGSAALSENAIEAYGSHYFRHDLYVHRHHRMALRQHKPVDGLHLSQDFLADDEILRTEFQNDFLRPFCDDIFYNAASTTLLPDGRIAILSLWRQRGQRAFTREQTDPLSRVGPHLGRALVLRHKLLGATAERDMGYDALDAMAQPMLLVESDGRIAFINLAAEQLVERAGWARFAVGGRLALRSQAEAQRFAQLVAAAIDPAAFSTEGTMRIEGAEDERPVEVLVAPFMPRRRERREGEKPLAVVLFSEPKPPENALARRAAASFGLTSTEATLAADLALGQSPDEIAARRSVRITTIRTQIRAVLGKTGASRQSELVRMLMRLPRLSEKN